MVDIWLYNLWWPPWLAVLKVILENVFEPLVSSDEIKQKLYYFSGR
jgi:hypothetical protein